MKILLLLISLSPFLNSQEMYEMEMTFENDQRSGYGEFIDKKGNLYKGQW